MDLEWKLLSDTYSFPACWGPVYQHEIKCICTGSFHGESENKHIIYADVQKWNAAECLISYFCFSQKYSQWRCLKLIHIFQNRSLEKPPSRGWLSFKKQIHSVPKKAEKQKPGLLCQLNNYILKEATTTGKTFLFLFLIYREKTSDTNYPQLSGLLSPSSNSIH